MDGYAVLYLVVAVQFGLALGMAVVLWSLLRESNAKDKLLESKDGQIHSLRQTVKDLQVSLQAVSRQEDDDLLHMGV
jgi:hypothetical protein